MNRESPILLIDTPGLIFRAFYSISDLSTADGFPTNAVYGVLLQVLRVIKDTQPSACAAFFDTPAPTFREKEFEEYKAQRPLPPSELIAQFPVVIEAFEKALLPVFLEPGYEADDLIASYASNHPQKLKYVLTGDKDMLQIVSDTLFVMMQTKGVTEAKLWTKEKVLETYGFPPANFVDFKALRGDPSDNIPGVSGVGDKHATKLILEYVNLEGVYEHIDEIKPVRIREALKLAKTEVFKYRELVRLRTDLKLAEEAMNLRLPDFSRKEFLEFCDKYALRAIKKQVLASFTSG